MQHIFRGGLVSQHTSGERKQMRGRKAINLGQCGFAFFRALDEQGL
ncbi:hypothetical protein [Achromobacter piechaudii]|nr:hypothetical protein [Achromobacter piechaudii]